MKQVLKSFLVSFLAALSFAQAAPQELPLRSGNTKFTAIGKPAMLRIAGTGMAPMGSLNIENNTVSGVLSVDLNTMNTGIELRDDHMKEKYLNTKIYPQASLQLEKIVLETPLSQITRPMIEKKFSGGLTLHGVQKDVQGTFDIEPQEGHLKITARYSVNLSDFKIDIPSYMGIKVADKVDIEVQFLIKK